MPRTARSCSGGYTYHVLNRGNAAGAVFHGADDYDAFLDLMAESSVRTPMRILAYCLMPNHFHLALWPRKDGQVSRWMHWLMTTQVRRYLARYRSSGHVWQGRFKAFPIQEDEHLLSVLRCIGAILCKRGWLGEPKNGRGRVCASFRRCASTGAARAGHRAPWDAVGGGRQRGHGRHRAWEHSGFSAPGPSVRDVGMDARDGKRSESKIGSSPKCVGEITRLMACWPLDFRGFPSFSQGE